MLVLVLLLMCAAAGAGAAAAGAGAAGAPPVLYHCRLHAGLLEDGLQRLKVVDVADAQLTYLRDRQTETDRANECQTTNGIPHMPLVTSKLRRLAAPPGRMHAYLYAVMLSICGRYQRQESK
jgi:hypothetical protein